MRHLMVAISSHLLRSDVTWARLISLFAVASSLAMDCVRQGIIYTYYSRFIIISILLMLNKHICGNYCHCIPDQNWDWNTGGQTQSDVRPSIFLPTFLSADETIVTIRRGLTELACIAGNCSGLIILQYPKVSGVDSTESLKHFKVVLSLMRICKLQQRGTLMNIDRFQCRYLDLLMSC